MDSSGAAADETRGQPSVQPDQSRRNFQSEPKNKIDIDMETVEEFLKLRGVISFLKNTLNLVALPLLILSGIGIGFILVWAEDILVPFVISIFFTYLLRPVVDFLHHPLEKVATQENACLPYSFQNVPCYGATNKSIVSSSSSTRFDRDILTEAVERTGLLEAANENEECDERGSNCFEDNDSNNGKKKPPRSIYDWETTVMGQKIAAKDVGCPRSIAVFLALCLALAVLSGLIVFFIDAVQRFEQNNWRKFEDRAVQLAIAFFGFLKRNFNIDGSKVFEEILKDVKVFEITTSLVVLLMDTLGYTFIVFLFVLYMLLEDVTPQARTTPQTLQAKDAHSRAILLRQQIDIQIQRYIVIKTLISALVGFIIYLILGPLLNVKMAHAFGVITFLANFIPNVGAIIATLLPLPILILDVDQTSLSMFLAVAIPVGIHTIVGNLVEPKVFGDTMELHAVVVLLSLSIWFAVWGVPGAILAVPITAVVRIIVSNMSHPYAIVILRLLEGKLPGTPEFHDSNE